MTKEYEALTSAIEKYADKPASKLPTKTRKRVEAEFPLPWDDLATQQRITVAQNIDAQRDPGQKNIQKKQFESGFEKVRLKNDIGHYKWRPHEKLPSEELKRIELVRDHESELEELESRSYTVSTSSPEGMPSAENWTAIEPPPGSAEFAKLLYKLINDTRFLPDSREQWVSLLIKKYGNEYDIQPSDRTGESLVYRGKVMTHKAVNTAIRRLKSRAHLKTP